MLLTSLRIALALLLVPVGLFVLGASLRAASDLGGRFGLRVNQYVTVMRPVIRPLLCIYVPVRGVLALWDDATVDLALMLIWAGVVWWLAGHGKEKDLDRSALVRRKALS